MLQISDVKYAMQFNERCRKGQRVIALKMIADFYNSNIGRVKGFKGLPFKGKFEGSAIYS
jgi:hypothetical protein